MPEDNNSMLRGCARASSGMLRLGQVPAGPLVRDLRLGPTLLERPYPTPSAPHRHTRHTIHD
jgi:hypothetical protein